MKKVFSKLTALFLALSMVLGCGVTAQAAETDEPDYSGYEEGVTVEKFFWKNAAEPAAVEFEDVSDSDWYAEAVRFCCEKGLMSGLGSYFSPDAAVPASTVLSALHKLDGGSGAVDTAIDWAAQNGITGEGFSTGEAVSREQLAQLLYAYAGYKGYDITASADLSNFNDVFRVSEEALPAMRWAIASGLMGGTSAESLDPTDGASRCQLAAVLARFCEGAAENTPAEAETEVPEYLTAKRDYSTLPDALTFSDGTAVSSAEDFEARREEILSLFAENVYGTIPTDGYDVNFTVVEQGEALDGAAIRKQINISVTTEKGTSDALMVLYLPANVEKAPVSLGLFMSGVHTILDDPEIISSYTYPKTGEALDAERGLAATRWQIAEAISKGYGTAVIFTNDFAPDNEAEYATRLISLFDDPEFKTISAWAFGLMRAVDYLETDEHVDASRIVLVGHSRCGKAALWAGANDERVALTISNESGTGGATLNCSICGETIGDITTSFPYWFCSKFASYAGRENELPVDQNLLLASFAPRKVYVAVAGGDENGDPLGAWNGLVNSLNAFELYGLKTIDTSLFDNGNFAGPAVSFSESTGFHLREGSHNITEEDWAFYFDYMDADLK